MTHKIIGEYSKGHHAFHYRLVREDSDGLRHLLSPEIVLASISQIKRQAIIDGAELRQI